MKNKWTYKLVKEVFEKHDCELLDESYSNNRQKLRFKCKCGNVYAKSFEAFMSGPQCRACGRLIANMNRMYTQDEVAEFFLEAGCELLCEYNGVKNALTYKCSCGEIAETTFCNFKKGRRCKVCKVRKLTGPNHPKWILDREECRRRKLFRKKCYKALSTSLKSINGEKIDHAHELLGYTPRQLQERIMAHPQWKDLADKEWHLDHIFPIKAFVEHGISDLKLINHLDNLRPVIWNENLSKSDRYDKQEFKEWIEQHGFDAKIS